MIFEVMRRDEVKHSLRRTMQHLLGSHKRHGNRRSSTRCKTLPDQNR